MTILLKLFSYKQNFIVFVVFLFTINNCKNSESVVLAQKNNSKDQIILRKAIDSNSIRIIGLEGRVILKNNSKGLLDFVNLKYNYNNLDKLYGIQFIVFNKGKRYSYSKIKSIKSNQSMVFVFETRHVILFYPKSELDLYLKEMQSKNQDTLHIGTIEEFKKKHPGFLEKLTKHDSIQISIRRKSDDPWEYIKIPVTY